MQILTFVTPNPQVDFDLWIKKSYPDIMIADRHVHDERAVDWFIDVPIDKSLCDQIRREFRIDVFQQDVNERGKKLFLADMDSTIVHGETLDEMAIRAGIGDKITEITARAMRGELDFESALTERVGMLAGLPMSVLEDTLADTKINEGADQLLRHLKAQGIYCVLISGGFTQFTSHFADMLGFDAHFGNALVIKDNALTGDVERPILDKEFKQKKLVELSASIGVKPHEAMAIGDGANDLPMLQAAGMGVGYYPKPLLKDALVNRIEYTDLASLIYVLQL